MRLVEFLHQRWFVIVGLITLRYNPLVGIRIYTSERHTQCGYVCYKTLDEFEPFGEE